MEALLPWIEPSAYGLLFLVVILVLGGRLITSKQLTRELGRERERAEEYRAAWQAADARADKLADTLSEALPLIRAVAQRSQVR
jgi:hypothetical protein